MHSSEKNTATDFSLESTAEQPVSLSSFKGSWVILYFYPKDATSGCTLEAVAFTALQPSFKKLHAVIIGISPDSPASHRCFVDKNSLSVLLLSDPNHVVAQQYGVWKKKKLYGREYFGIIRTTLLIDPEGIIRKRWEKVSVNDHAEAVLQTLKEMLQS